MTRKKNHQGDENVLALPCLVVGKPMYESSNGYRILRVVANTASPSFKDICEKIPYDWREAKNFNRGDFVVTVNSDHAVDVEVPFVFIGTVVEHPKYGHQFNAINYCSDDPTNERTMIEYLSRLPNIGEVRARTMIEMFGLSEIGNVIEKKCDDLVRIVGITKARAEIIRDAWVRDRNIRKVFMWLLDHDLPAIYGNKILKEFGKDSINVIEKNPYALTKIRGIGFETADEIAHKIFGEVPTELRTESCLWFLLKENEYNGHVCLPIRLLRREALRLLESKGTQDNYASLIDKVASEKMVIVAHKDRDIAFVYLPYMYKNERYNAGFLASIKDIETHHKYTEDQFERAESECAAYVMKPTEFKFDEKQKNAVRSAFENKITVITGGGGTGKSTICRAICQIAKENNYSVRLLAPTGQAAKVLGKKTSISASTIHRGLGLLPGGPCGVSINPTAENPWITEDILIIDEFSMVGTDILPFVFGAILNINTTNIVFVGDPQQLPSVSPGNNLRDIIISGCAEVVKLEQIYRQSENSHITIVADEISRGVPFDPPKDSDDFFWITCGDNMKVLENIRELCKTYDDIREVQFLSSIYHRTCGVNRINELIQELYTKESARSVVCNSRIFYFGDRVMHVVNNYSKGVFNGNVGYIIDLGCKVINSAVSDEPKDYIVVEFDEGKGKIGKQILYTGKDEIDELRVAWCSTVHKFQGSQMERVVFLMIRDHYRMMNREHVYTAFTRAEKSLHVIGTEDMVRLAAAKSVIANRYTNMVLLYKKLLGEDIPLKFRFPEGYDINSTPFDDIDRKEYEENDTSVSQDEEDDDMFDTSEP